MIPNVSGSLNGWMKKYSIRVITKTVVDHEVSEISVEKILFLNLQPIPAEVVNRKLEEQRSWKWFNIFSKNKLEMKIDDRVYISGKYYRIQEIKAWNEAGYYEYEAIEDFNQDEAST